jgi:hypothetical protein
MIQPARFEFYTIQLGKVWKEPACWQIAIAAPSRRDVMTELLGLVICAAR